MTVYDANNVPVLYLGEGRDVGMSETAHTALQKAHAKSDESLLGEVVLIHNKAPVNGGDPGFTSIGIGASNLDEAVKDAIGSFDAHVGDPDQSSDHLHRPDWVASTHKDLAKALADYYSCEVRPIAEVLS